jgi:hypothetical protein
MNPDEMNEDHAPQNALLPHSTSTRPTTFFMTCLPRLSRGGRERGQGWERGQIRMARPVALTRSEQSGFGLLPGFG